MKRHAAKGIREGTKKRYKVNGFANQGKGWGRPTNLQSVRQMLLRDLKERIDEGE